MSDPEDEVKQGPFLFGRDVSKIPCFRNTFLYGITSGFGAGLTYFLFTSRTTTSSHVAAGTFVGVSLSYWIYCRLNWSKQKFEYQKLKYAMKQQMLYEGTELEEKLKDYAKKLEESEKLK
ncbi:cytochrome c oxidase assembly protein COX20, mitochondrial [Schistocerca nitens]|uniref:cytochrome c oxidase assembly protein COX20, mitochondrial n=1 Tax=Schistocerca nitens TaxID=7011 RepID=UPI0021172F2B|nr:cytochrome c oxidase assembly protein COX20, mitochondrial [Schistocerca nitens]